MKNLVVDSLKDQWILNANSHQVGNGKESPVIDAFVRILPVGEQEILLG